MNKKGKNKKGKTFNPVPAQKDKPKDKVEELAGSSDKEIIEQNVEINPNVEQKIESVKEERVPEIVTEVIPASVDTKDEETPKKPKRNRGKKKKGTDGYVDDNMEGDLQVTELSSVIEKALDTVEVIKEPQDDTFSVVPIARKKKNKKNNEERQIEELILQTPEQSLPLEAVTSVVQVPQAVDIAQQLGVEQLAVEHEIKPSKKKNKKKKRNDSEKSDKEDISPTVTSVKILNVKEELFEIKSKTKLDLGPIDNIEFERESQLQKYLVTEESNAKNESETGIDFRVEQLPEDQKPTFKGEESVVHKDENLIELVSAPIQHESLDIIDQNELKNVIPEETTSKHRAIIAKPVEKKRKGKQESEIVETLPQDTLMSVSPNIEECPQLIILDSPDLRETDKETGREIKSSDHSQNKLAYYSKVQVVTDTKTPSKELTAQETESLNLPDKTTGKKRRKGQKLPKTADISHQMPDNKIEIHPNLPEIKTVNIVEDLSPPIESISTQGSHTTITTEMPLSISKTEVPTDAESITLVEKQEHVLLTPEIIYETDTMKLSPTHVTDSIHKQGPKSDKKRRKSPKPEKKEADLLETEESKSQSADLNETSMLFSKKSKETVEKVDASNITKLYDIEITSINVGESDSSPCDVVPDITYPRSSSQQLPDNNNNSTTIREIFPVQQITCNYPVQEYHKDSKDVIMKPKQEFSPPKTDKTDLKSKMMEVNQDMEDLRLSIERSLAELTSMEKHEETNIKQCQEFISRSKESLSKIKDDVDVKQTKAEQGINVAISDTEKSASIEQHKIQQSALFTAESSSVKETEIWSENTRTVDVVSDEAVKPISVKEAELNFDKTDSVLTTEESIKAVTDTKTSTLTPTTIAEKLTDTLLKFDTKVGHKSVTKRGKVEEAPTIPEIPISTKEKAAAEQEFKHENTETKSSETEIQSDIPPICPMRKDQKNKNKKKRGKVDIQTITSQPAQSIQGTANIAGSSSTTSQEAKKEEKSNTKKEDKDEFKGQSKGEGKQRASDVVLTTDEESHTDAAYQPIESFEDALTSSVDDVNQSFEMIVKESQQSNPKINIIAPDDEKSTVKPPKNLLGHPDIPVRSNKRDYKKEKDKIPNEINAIVTIKDSVEVETKQSKNTQTVNKLNDVKYYKTSENEEFVYKYNFRKVFLQNTCHICKKDLSGSRVACCYCNLVFYCGIKHKDEDWPQHQALCFAVSTIGHLKNQKHIYADVKNISGHDYRLIRMQMIVSCEKILKRRLLPWEQEALLYPRICAYVPCREWRQMKLSDCQGCAQISYCTDNPDHCPKSHSRWCKSYSLYQKLVSYQQTKGRLEPKLPTKIIQQPYEIPEKINEVFAEMYEEKIDMNDIQYAALTQVASAPLTAAYCYQLCTKTHPANGCKKSTFSIHVVGAELQFEADALNKWEVFFLHLRPDLQELRVALINANLNPSKLPLNLLGRIRLCENCQQNKRKVVFNFHEKTYADYKRSDDFVLPDIVCAFNPSVQRSSVYNGKDPWPSTANIIIKQKVPFLITAYTMTELQKDCVRIKECSEPTYSFICEPKCNNFASVRPDRNFISDDEMPLLFKNYCFAVICG